MTTTRRRPVRLVMSGLILAVLLVATFGGVIIQSVAHAPHVKAASVNESEDDFTRANQTGWGTSTNTDGNLGQAWSGDVGGSKGSISSNAGVITQPQCACYQYGYIGNSYNGGDIVGTFNFNGDSNDPGIGALLNASTNGQNEYDFRAYLFNPANTIEVDKVASGSLTAEASTSFTFNTNTAYDFRLDFNVAAANTLKVKVWAASGSEPSSWTVSWTDTGTVLGAGNQGVIVQ